MNTIDKISFVIPVYNEEENLEILFSELVDVMSKIKTPYEVIMVDDGSTDKSLNIIRSLSAGNLSAKYLSFAYNMGQSAAFAAGFQEVSGDVVITMDADLQNDPHDIPSMLELYKQYDMVVGWRYKRNDSPSRRIASLIGNSIRSLVTGDSIHDTGCSLKVMKASILKKVKLFRGSHRFLSTLMRLEGATVVEVRVNHRARKFGVSKYTNLKRGMEGLADLFAVFWMIKRNIPYSIKEASGEH